jgi:hypothetical protein
VILIVGQKLFIAKWRIRKMNEVESKQKDWGLIALEQSKGLEVKTQQDYDNIAEMCRDIKGRVKQIAEYWKPLKDSAYKQWKAICSKEKELLNPFENAEKEIKVKMATYQKAKLEEERLIREEAERAKKEEEERLLALAKKAEAEGREENAEYLLEVAEQVKHSEIKLPKEHKTEGASRRVTWKARVIDKSKVPCEVMGMEIRPIDHQVLNKIAVMSKGKAVIEGVVFEEDVNISIRA